MINIKRQNAPIEFSLAHSFQLKSVHGAKVKATQPTSFYAHYESNDETKTFTKLNGMSSSLKQLWKHSASLIILGKNPSASKVCNANANYKVSAFDCKGNDENACISISIFYSHCRFWYWSAHRNHRIQERLYFQAGSPSTSIMWTIGCTCIRNSASMAQNWIRCRKIAQNVRSFSNRMLSTRI